MFRAAFDQAKQMRERRHFRVGQLLREEVSAILQHDVKDPRVTSLYVTELNITPDGKTAQTYVTRMGSVEDINSGKGLSREESKAIETQLFTMTPFVMQLLKKRLHMKMIPTVRFKYDIRLPDLSKIWSKSRSASELKEVVNERD